MLQTETRLLTGALQRRATGTGLAAGGALDAAIASRPSLAEEQEQMVRTICSSGDGVEIVEGVARAGQTFALAAARHAWQASGHRVIGCSLAARAAQPPPHHAGLAYPPKHRPLTRPHPHTTP